MKKTKELLLIIIFLVGIMVLNNTVFASSNVLKVVEQSSETKYLENDQGYISKTIVDSDEKAGEVTIELKLGNTSNKENIITNQITENSEIVLVIDDSGSMIEYISTGISREEAVYNAAEELVNKLFSNYNNIKIGVVKFAGGFEGSIDDAKKMCDLTNNKETVISAINAEANVGGTTNLEAGILVAKTEFSTDASNKIMIILTDGAPNGSTRESEKTTKEATKETLINTSNSGINIITMLTEIENEEIALNIFGTQENPTVGKYYYIADSDISKIISDSIYNDVVEKIHVLNEQITETKIVDYFPQDITDNFEFSYEGDGSIGTKTDSIDAETNTITWNIGTLKGDEVATLRYKLKLKDMNNSALLEKVISTNEKVVLTYKDNENKDYTVILDSSPKIKLTNEEKVDETIASVILPKTGKDIMIYGVIAVVAIIGLLAAKKYYKYKDIK